MRVEVLTDRPAERFAVDERLYPEGSASGLTIVESWPADPGWVLRFGEVPTREAAEAFRLVYLEVEAGPRDLLPADAFFWHEMIGVAVRDPAGAPLGVVRDVYRAGGADVLEVVDGPRGAFDLPIARPFTVALDPRRGEIVADPEALDLPAHAPPPRPLRPPRPRRATRRRPAVPQAPSPAIAGEEAAPAIGDGAPSVEPAPSAERALTGAGEDPSGEG